MVSRTFQSINLVCRPTAYTEEIISSAARGLTAQNLADSGEAFGQIAVHEVVTNCRDSPCRLRNHLRPGAVCIVET
jgi:hypothetical protein